MRPQARSYVPLDEARLRPHLRKPEYRPKPYYYTPVDAAHTGPPSTVVFTWEPQDLRGIPIVGRGVGGVSPGTHPERANTTGRAGDWEGRTQAA